MICCHCYRYLEAVPLSHTLNYKRLRQSHFYDARIPMFVLHCVSAPPVTLHIIRVKGLSLIYDVILNNKLLLLALMTSVLYNW